MIEYIYNAIKATAGEDITIAASITDDNNQPITSGCTLEIFDDEEVLVTIDGVYADDLWSFVIPADATINLKGRYWYTINNQYFSLCFKDPIYLM